MDNKGTWRTRKQYENNNKHKNTLKVLYSKGRDGWLAKSKITKIHKWKSPTKMESALSWDHIHFTNLRTETYCPGLHVACKEHTRTNIHPEYYLEMKAQPSGWSNTRSVRMGKAKCSHGRNATILGSIPTHTGFTLVQCWGWNTKIMSPLCLLWDSITLFTLFTWAR